MITGNQVFNQALVFIDEVSDTGQVVSDNPNYYKSKATHILTTLQTELLPHDVEPVVITDLAQPLLVSDRDALLILPYGLGAHLLMQEDMATAAFLNNRYEELKRKRQSKFVPIEDTYDVLGGMG